VISTPNLNRARRGEKRSSTAFHGFHGDPEAVCAAFCLISAGMPADHQDRQWDGNRAL